MTNKWLTIKEIADLLLVEKCTVIRKAQKENWPYRSHSVRGGQERRYHLLNLPADIQTAYASSIKLSLADLQSQLKPSSKPEKKISIPRYSGRGARTAEIKIFEKTPEEYLQIAAARRKVLEAYSVSGLSPAQFVSEYNSGMILSEIRSQLGGFGEIKSKSSLYRWLGLYEKHGLTGLAPQYSLRRGGAGASLTERAKDLIQALYLDQNKPSVASVIRTINENKFLDRDLNYDVVNRYVNKEISFSVKTFYRQGEKAYHDKCNPYIQRDYTLLKSMEWGCADHHLFDFVISHSGRIFRPWLTMFIDMRSRKITGWHIDVVPNTLTIMRAFYMSVETCGLFENLLIDNGKDFKSSWFAGNEWKMRRTRPEKETLQLIEGVLHDCGTKAHFATPYHGQSKPIERAFRTIIELFSKEQPTYVGSNTVDRKADTDLYWRKINGRDRVEVTFTLEELREDFAKFAAWHNTEWRHSGQGMGGQAPDAVFSANLEARREMPEEMRKYVFAIREKRTVQKKGITVDGIDYYNEKMIQFIGQRVEVRRGINDAGKISIFSLPDCIYQFDAENNVLKDRGIPEENIRRLRNIQKKTRAHLKEYAKDAAEIRSGIKKPYEILAEQNKEALEDERLVVNGSPLGTPGMQIVDTPKTKKQKIINILDVD